MKNEKIFLRLMWIIALLPFLITIAVYGRLPQEIPMHWNIHGEIDAWYPKFPWAFLMPLTGLGIPLLVSVLAKIDPKKENYGRFKETYVIIRFILVAFFAVMQFVVIATSLGATFIKVDTMIKLMIGILFIVLGNLMPKFKQNYFMGIKTPWTLADETVWAKTHRHGGFVWFAAGFIMSVLAFLPGLITAGIYFGLVLVVALEPIIYSWLKYKELH
ncbi:putative integral membrane protein [Desulfosporosinus orientis DSM 765]|uniref:Putative integral membrane protein n=1 Tax=Desulfosporosinus orientis (strain ATCC 19365 / DSM 765 / NCIMB 8382 / VKM B-1628 / Singapore I) TaxID=768706 RepID=G7WF31_DESOD|nr:SdpI family protein [Desulfosporosinus orientis]AET67642.1 putative integral membrane protein [Desulfosporosinus orientis DSM 765]